MPAVLAQAALQKKQGYTSSTTFRPCFFFRWLRCVPRHGCSTFCFHGLIACGSWVKQKPQPVFVLALRLGSHTRLFSDKKKRCPRCWRPVGLNALSLAGLPHTRKYRLAGKRVRSILRVKQKASPALHSIPKTLQAHPKPSYRQDRHFGIIPYTQKATNKAN